ncbi:Uu.00g080750.m01.CDS01 [Anthostomella pinea]|uniref:Uu.00g080750.m01.CDS01 n=1 Tax=Anthostomella pinea TaxID=933095 RepID=A0AAI8VL32_9PEZI|nr:Uu.00g080750.m01.CDS01 [Anthostomella pinea]
MLLELLRSSSDLPLGEKVGTSWPMLGSSIEPSAPIPEHDQSNILPPTTETGTDKRPLVLEARGNHIRLADGRDILDACGGAAVACIGHGVEEVVDAMVAQAAKVSYVAWGFFDNPSRRELSRWLSQSSGGHFTKSYVTCSGSEAIEGAMKLAHEYFVWKGEPQRINYISRAESYHGITLAALSLGGHLIRRAPFEPLLVTNVHRIPACNSYRQRLPGEIDEDFVLRKAAELDKAFIEIGPDTVAAFVAEPVVGAASGCIPSVPGYFKAIKAVCDKHGALLVLDEVMCGMGRTGTLHAWEQEGVLPDIQAVGKGLAGGYQPVSAILVSKKIVDMMESKQASFTHGHTYQDHPVGCAAAMKVQQIIQSNDLLANVRTQGQYLEHLLRSKLRSHPNVGDIRGRGLFWGTEFVRDKETKKPFDPKLQISHRLHERALRPPYNMALYYGQGCAGQSRGDHVMIMPAYNVTRDVIETIVDKFTAVVHEVFDGLATQGLS